MRRNGAMSRRDLFREQVRFRRKGKWERDKRSARVKNSECTSTLQMIRRTWQNVCRKKSASRRRDVFELGKRCGAKSPPKPAEHFKFRMLCWGGGMEALFCSGQWSTYEKHIDGKKSRRVGMKQFCEGHKFASRGEVWDCSKCRCCRVHPSAGKATSFGKIEGSTTPAKGCRRKGGQHGERYYFPYFFPTINCVMRDRWVAYRWSFSSSHIQRAGNCQNKNCIFVAVDDGYSTILFCLCTSH